MSNTPIIGGICGWILSKPSIQEKRIPVTGWKKCLSGNTSCLSLISFVPTTLSYTPSLSLCTFRTTPEIMLLASDLSLYISDAKFVTKKKSEICHVWCFQKEGDKAFVDLCKRLMANLQEGNCNLKWKKNNGRVQLESVGINGNGKAHFPLHTSHLPV